MKIPFLTKWLARSAIEENIPTSEIPAQVPVQPKLVTEVCFSDTWNNFDLVRKTIRNSSDAATLIPLFEHYNGHIREAAIRRCAAVIDASAIPALVDRLNDWVPQVRQAAQSTLRAYFLVENAPLLVSLLPTFSNLQNCRRDQHDIILSELEQFLGQTANRPAIIDGLRSADMKVARECFRLVEKTKAMMPIELAWCAIRSKDLVVASMAMRLSGKIDDALRLELIQAGLRSPFATVRGAALLDFLRSDSDRKLETARQMLFDRQSIVREIAWNWLERQGENIGAHYVSILENANQTSTKISCALWAVAKLRLLDTLPLIDELITSPSSRVRSAAILTMAKLDSTRVPQLLDLALNDISPGTNKVAFLLIKYYGATVTYAKLEQLLHTPNGIHMALQISRRESKWDWLACIFEVTIHHQASVVKTDLSDELRDWIIFDSRNSANPSQKQLDRLHHHVQCGVLEKIEASYKKRIEFILQCSGISTT